MIGQAQRQELHSKIWRIAADVRGAVDGWYFKQYVLGILFYRFISENFAHYIGGGEFDYANGMTDDQIIPEVIDDAVKTKGYFIKPSQLFVHVVKSARQNENLNTELKAIFDAIEASAVGYVSENGNDLNETLPKMSPLNPAYRTKKQIVFQKISALVEKFKGVGGSF